MGFLLWAMAKNGRQAKSFNRLTIEPYKARNTLVPPPPPNPFPQVGMCFITQNICDLCKSAVQWKLDMGKDCIEFKEFKLN